MEIKRKDVIFIILGIFVVFCLVPLVTLGYQGNEIEELKEKLKEAERTVEQYKSLNTECNWMLEQWNEWYSSNQDTIDLLQYYKEYVLNNDKAK